MSKIIHHITPRCMLKHKPKSFVNDPRNLATLNTFEEHLKAHKWLFMLTGDEGCERAYRLMKSEKCDFSGGKHTQKTRQKMSRCNTGSQNPMYGSSRIGIDAPMYGKSHSPETKLVMSDLKKGLPLSQEHRDKLSENSPKYWKGKKFSIDHCNNMSDVRKGIPLSIGTRMKMSQIKTGNNNATKRVVIDGIVFDSSKEAANHFNVSPASITYWCKSKKKTNCFRL